MRGFPFFCFTSSFRPEMVVKKSAPTAGPLRLQPGHRRQEGNLNPARVTCRKGVILAEVQRKRHPW
ncbi:hypothetical protein GALL_536000 [mine drainage metagenome]|uniref:Uncharacterized protein n=1 Tax=mine drainage metagenome TaxID=410659 RepID=A0A1J5P2G2_9ZZZZ